MHVSCFGVVFARGGCVAPRGQKEASFECVLLNTPITNRFTMSITREELIPRGKLTLRFSNWTFDEPTPETRLVAIAFGDSSPPGTDHQDRTRIVSSGHRQASRLFGFICGHSAGHHEHGGRGRRPERRRDLHVRGAMARVRDELERESPFFRLPPPVRTPRVRPIPRLHPTQSDPAKIRRRRDFGDAPGGRSEPPRTRRDRLTFARSTPHPRHLFR